MKRALVALLAVVAVVGGLAVGMLAAGGGAGRLDGRPRRRSPALGSPPVVAAPPPPATPSRRRRAHADARPDARRRPRPRRPSRRRPPSRRRSPAVLVPPAVAARHPIAVMIDDLGPARPQSGFSAASVVWQAPAEGGIPRYMLIFQENIPTDVGPVRSSRYYYIAWAAEWRAVYAHAGGSPQALADAPREGQRPARLQRRRVPLGRTRSGGSRTASRRTTSTRRQAPAQARQERRREGRADEAGLEVRAGRAARAAPAAGRPIQVAYPYNPITLPLRPARPTRTCAR